jgi:hypothetical protein
MHGCGLYWFESGRGPVTGACELDNELRIKQKAQKIDQMSDY